MTIEQDGDWKGGAEDTLGLECKDGSKEDEDGLSLSLMLFESLSSLLLDEDTDEVDEEEEDEDDWRMTNSVK